MRKKAVMNWSGGKDSALALYKVLQSEEYEVVSLLTTVNRETLRSSMHGIPIGLLQEQAKCIGIPIQEAYLDPSGEMSGYNEAMSEAVKHFKSMGVTHFIFGDIFLHDVRSYREVHLNPYGIEVVEPLWDKTSAEVMEEFLQSGLQTVVVSTMADKLNETFIGQTINRSFVERIPEEVDVCGENGEFHTFCFDGPLFRSPVRFSMDETPIRVSHDVTLDTGEVRTYHYWYGKLKR